MFYQIYSGRPLSKQSKSQPSHYVLKKTWAKNSRKSNSRHLTVFRKPYHKMICRKHDINKKLLSIPRNNVTVPSVMVILKHVKGAYYNKCGKSIYKGELTTLWQNGNEFKLEKVVSAPNLRVTRLCFLFLPHGGKTAYRPNYKHRDAIMNLSI